VSDSTAPTPETLLPEACGPEPAKLMPEACGPVTPPFVPNENMPNLVLAALRKTVSKDTVGLHSPAVERLALVLNIIRWKIWFGPRGDTPGLKQIEMDALWRWALGGMWPTAWPVREEPHRHAVLILNYDRIDEADVEVIRQKTKRALTTGLWFWQTREDEELAKHYQRAGAAAELRKQALEIARPILDMCEIGGWPDFAPALTRIFCAELPGQPKEAAYRFMEAMMPEITGEVVHADTIDRSVNRAHEKTENSDRF
jgi:hypothetical protein